MQKAVTVISLYIISFLLPNTTYDEAEELRVFLIEHFKSGHMALEKQKADSKRILSPQNIDNLDTFTCLKYDGKLSLISVDIENVNSREFVIDEESKTETLWSKKFRKLFRGKAKERVRMSDPVRLKKGYYLIAFHSSYDYWADLIWKNEKGEFQICQFAYVSYD